jgi:hypothetical protein
LPERAFRFFYHHKTPPTIRRSEYLPAYRALFGANGETSHIWERTYAIVSPKGKKIAGVTEIFSPKLEALLTEHQGSSGFPLFSATALWRLRWRR